MTIITVRSHKVTMTGTGKGTGTGTGTGTVAIIVIVMVTVIVTIRVIVQHYTRIYIYAIINNHTQQSQSHRDRYS